MHAMLNHMFHPVGRCLAAAAVVLGALASAGCSSGGGSTESAAVGAVPVLTVQSAPTATFDGESITFAVKADIAGPHTYTWKRDQVPIPGESGSSYVLSPVTLADHGAEFGVEVRNVAGTASTSFGRLSVQPAAAAIAGQPQPQSVLAGERATFGVIARGTAPLSFQWRRNGQPIAGATAASYVTGALDVADAGAVYDVAITNAVGSVVSAPVTLSVTRSVIAPSASQASRAVSAAVGDTVTFDVAATGTAPLSYQWRRNGSPIAGATAASYTLSSVAGSNDQDVYTVVVSNSAGSVTSGQTVLSVTAAGGIDLLAGRLGGPGNLDGIGTAARFDSPSGLAVDAAGNLYVADQNNGVIRRISPAGAVATLAGSSSATGSVDGTAAAARFRYPAGAALDSDGNLYFSDSANHTIRKLTPGGIVTTLAGNPGSSGTADGAGSAARFHYPSGVAVDAAGNVYVADEYNHAVRRISPAGEVSTLAGTAGSAGATDGAGSTARFDHPGGVAVDAAGNVYVADQGNHAVRRISAAGQVSTLAGTLGSTGSANGSGADARFDRPYGIAADASGNVFVTELGNGTVRKVTAGGTVTTLAGTAGRFGTADGTGPSASFDSPSSAALDAAGNLYVTDRYNHTIRRITPAGVVTTAAGAAYAGGSADGTGSAAQFSSPRDVATDAAGNVYLADQGNHTIRKITPAGAVTTLAGMAGSSGAADGTGSAARFTHPIGVVVDAAGNVYVSDHGNHAVRKITPAGVVTTLAGLAGTHGSADGTGSAARFHAPQDLAIDASGNLYVADGFNFTIRKITPAGVVTTLAGSSGSTGSTDGTGSAARFYMPHGIEVDPAGNVYVSDYFNQTIRKITPAGGVTTLAGSVGVAGSADGTGSAARFNNPSSLTIDAAGGLYVADPTNGLIRKVDTATGAVTTVAGSTARRGMALGRLPGSIAGPYGIAMLPVRTGTRLVITTSESSVLTVSLP